MSRCWQFEVTGKILGGAMTVTDRIEINPKVMMGKPVVRGDADPY